MASKCPQLLIAVSRWLFLLLNILYTVLQSRKPDSLLQKGKGLVNCVCKLCPLPPLQYLKSISVTSAILISEVQPCPTSSGISQTGFTVQYSQVLTLSILSLARELPLCGVFLQRHLRLMQDCLSLFGPPNLVLSVLDKLITPENALVYQTRTVSLERKRAV